MGIHRNYFIILILQISFCLCYSQSHFKPGYVITYEGDSINGYIDVGKQKRLFKECKFKESKNGEIIYYTPDELIEFRIEKGKYYVSKALYNKGIEEKYFFEYLLNGIADLYYLKTDKDKYYFQNNNIDWTERSNRSPNSGLN